MIFILNYKVDIVDIFTLSISLIALVATLRKKEFGKLYFITKNDAKDDIWVQVIKSDLYDVKIVCEPYKNMSCRINILKENSDSESVLAFPNETKPTVEIAILKVNTILKFRACNSTKIHIQYKDKYNNCYSQEMKQNEIGKRRHLNIWNLTFVGG